ncbi:MAG TPA: IPT/TIG domain-containing protein [Solirubrobacter sp.]|nr:IPT/TIG domain-containing protein [Solirubrobacter sp.]
METRPRTRLLRRAVITAALGALVVPASAGAAVKKPVIKKVTPKTVSVGETLTIHGKYFRAGKGKNTVLFKRDKGKALFVKAGLSTKKKITVVIPKTLEKFMADKDGAPTATRFRLRVLTRKLSRTFTSRKASPVVRPAKAKGDGSDGGGVSKPPVCPAGGPNGDDDGDMLANFNEADIKTDPCKADTDGDGIWDSYEYWSALDLNRGNTGKSIPYPGKRPYPNPLDGTDGDTDFDGDVMTLREEFTMWTDPRYGNKSAVLNYSDGKQTTTGLPAPSAADRNTPSVIWDNDPTMRFLDADHNGAISAAEVDVLDFNRDGDVSASEFTYQDLDGDGRLSDDEMDVDGDGLINYDEAHGRMIPGYWAGVYEKEVPYTAWVNFLPPDYLTPDSDGDGIVDALDDQDDDSFVNIVELSRRAAQDPTDTFQSAYGQVHPLNPCLPAMAYPFEEDFNTGLPTTQLSPTCMRHPPISNGPAPFDKSSPKYPNYDINN